jgi:hypothetical protein
MMRHEPASLSHALPAAAVRRNHPKNEITEMRRVTALVL